MSTLELENIKHPDNANTNIALASNGSIIVDRRSTDGTIAEFRKDGTAVGNIGVEGGDVTIGRSTSGLQFRAADPCIRPHNMSTNSPSDNAVDLGRFNTRFKDLYLSSGVYIGGTGWANHLDDYEEGTWTPSIAGNATYTARTGQYVKVGRMVTAAFDMTINAINSSASNSSINGLPFAAGGSAQGQAGSVSYWSGAASSLTYIGIRVDLGSGSLGLSFTTSAVSTAQLSLSFWQNGARMIGTITYVTA